MKSLVEKLTKKKLKICVVESCTGGLLSSALTSINGSSKVFAFGVVAYSNQSKIKVLKVSKNIIKKYGAVSKKVCKAMLKNTHKISKTDISISITGIAGSEGGTKEKPVGLVYVGIKINNKINIKKPFPVSFFDKNFKNSFGVIMDDVCAGLYVVLSLICFMVLSSYFI